MQPLSLNVCFFEQTAQSRPVRLRNDQDYAGPVPHLEVARIAAVCQAFVQAAAYLYKSTLGGLQNESRNDFDYRFGGVLVGWRRLVLGARARLTQAVPETNCRSGAGHGI
jgi:hypothetical protein